MKSDDVSFNLRSIVRNLYSKPLNLNSEPLNLCSKPLNISFGHTEMLLLVV